MQIVKHVGGDLIDANGELVAHRLVDAVGTLFIEHLYDPPELLGRDVVHLFSKVHFLFKRRLAHGRPSGRGVGHSLELLLELLAEFVREDVKVRPFDVVKHAVGPDQAHVAREIRGGLVLVPRALNGRDRHRLLHDLRVVEEVQLLPRHGLEERDHLRVRLEHVENLAARGAPVRIAHRRLAQCVAGTT